MENETLLYQIYGKGVTAEQVYQYIAKDPYWFARCFQQRVRIICFLYNNIPYDIVNI